jgi:hypothetical protein
VNVYDYPKLRDLPLAVKHMLVAMAVRGWKDIADGFTMDFTAARPGLPTPDQYVEWAREVFPDATWEGAKITITGEAARDFKALYLRATKMPLGSQ